MPDEAHPSGETAGSPFEGRARSVAECGESSTFPSGKSLTGDASRTGRSGTVVSCRSTCSDSGSRRPPRLDERPDSEFDSKSCRRVEGPLRSMCDDVMAVMRESIPAEPRLRRLPADFPLLVRTMRLAGPRVAARSEGERTSSSSRARASRRERSFSRDGRRKGRRKVNLEPSPTLDSTLSCPSSLRTMRATTASPSPTLVRPSGRSSSPAVETCSSSRKIPSRRASEIPQLREQGY